MQVCANLFCIWIPGCRIKLCSNARPLWLRSGFLFFIVWPLQEKEQSLDYQVSWKQAFVLKIIPHMQYWRIKNLRLTDWNYKMQQFNQFPFPGPLNKNDCQESSTYILIHAYCQWTQLCNYKCGIFKTLTPRFKQVISASLRKIKFHLKSIWRAPVVNPCSSNASRLSLLLGLQYIAFHDLTTSIKYWSLECCATIFPSCFASDKKKMLRVTRSIWGGEWMVLF